MSGLFQKRIRGFRVIEAGAAGLLLVLVMGVYLAKAGAGRERSDIAAVQAQIEDEQQHLRLLQAEVAHLEQPTRLERLSQQYLGLQAIASQQETSPGNLAQIARAAQLTRAVKPAAPAAPATGLGQ